MAGPQRGADADRLPMNPWLTMWVRPRATMRAVLAAGPDLRVLMLAAIGGVESALDRAVARSLGDRLSLPGVLAVCLVGGTIAGIVGVYLFAPLLRWTGRWLGGTASTASLRAATAWPHVLTAWRLPLWLPVLVIFGPDLFTTATPRFDSWPILWVLWYGLASLDVVIGVWIIVAHVKCTGEAQGFSAWRALVNQTLAGLVLLVPITIALLLASQ